MSTTPMTPAQWRSQLKKWGVKFREVGDWDHKNSGRDDETGLKFGPVFGGVMHHTGSDGADSINRDLIDRGRSDLPGPLAHAGLNDDGVIDLFTTGRANHAGGGDPKVLAAVKAEKYGKYPPQTRKHQGSPGAADGNDAFYGLEAYYSGSKKVTDAAYESACRFWAAILDFHGWSAKSLIGHKEWSDWKPDPGLIDMADMRDDVQSLLDKGPGSTAAKPKHKTPHISNAIKANIAYEKSLDKIKHKALQGKVKRWKTATARQRRALRKLERK